MSREYVYCHDTAKRMRNNVYTSVLGEAWIIGTPQLVDTIRFFDDSSNHLRLVMRKIVWNVQHDIRDDIPD